MAVEQPSPNESLRRYAFGEFRDGILWPLKNWEVFETEANRYTIRHKKFDTGRRNYFLNVFVVNRRPGRELGNRISFEPEDPYGRRQLQLLDVREFHIGLVDIGQAEESEAIRFLALNQSAFEIRDSGLVIYRNANTVDVYNPEHPFAKR